MKIAQLSTPLIPVPPPNYGGTELVVHNITEELVKRGHEVTLFATGDSKTSAKLVAPFSNALNPQEMERLFSPLALRLFWTHSLPSLYHAVSVFERASEFDIIHDHFHYIGLVFSNVVKTPVLHTYHGDLKTAQSSTIERLFFEKYRNLPWTAISESQKKNSHVPLNFVSVIHHGVPIEKFSFNENPEDYLVWVGRITPKKGLHYAIQTAKQVGKPLKIAGVIHPRDEEFFQKEIKPHLDEKLILFVGALGLEDKVSLLKNAKALLYPVTWEEPFGLVMIEAMATGTPVIAFAHGAVSEVIVNEETGFLILGEGSVEALVDATKKIYSLPQGEYTELRKRSRKRVEDNFTVEKMVDKYEKVYQSILK
ncbi:glycosyltransferase family 4 protein [Candidatus Roizmanbacteria bacterium]|nr:glycosyltransferase family 4 protein [Candidatus Roizmanbacteria bacterium]